MGETPREKIQLFKGECSRLHVACDLGPIGILEQRAHQVGMLQRDGARGAGFRGYSQSAKIQLTALLIDGDGEKSMLRNGIQISFERLRRLKALVVSNACIF